MTEGKKAAALVLGIIGIVCDGISLFAFWWLSIIGLVLGIISLCLGNKVLGGVSIGIGGIVLVLEIILMAFAAGMAGY